MMDTEKKTKEHLSNKNINRVLLVIKVLAALLIMAVVIVIISLIRGKSIGVQMYSIPCRVSGKVRILALADLHGSMHGNNQEQIVSRVQEADPDLIVYLGDMIERSRITESVESLEVLTEQLAKIAPLYYVDGNHEEDVKNSDAEAYEKLNAALADLGAVQLENETMQLILGDDCIVNLCGITTHYHWQEKENKVVKDLCERDGINIMICHYPESVLWYDAFDGGGLDLAICGHTHGGLIRIPILGGVYAPEAGWFPRYDLGEYLIYSDTSWSKYGGEEGSEYWGTMIVSGGLAGEHGIPRINNPMEISVVDIS